MKALHILKIVLKDTVMSREKECIQEAIAELESLIEEQKRDQVNASMSQKESVDLLNKLEQLQNRSCESCIYYNDRRCSRIDDNYTEHYCGYFMPPEDFYCKYYERKEDEC